VAHEGATPLRVAMVDVYVLHLSANGLEALLLRRAPGARSPGSWECVHGHIDDGETPVQAALRELAEETGLQSARFYNLSRVEMFYSHRLHQVALIPAFAAIIQQRSEPTLSREHESWEWLPIEQAAQRVSWPRLRRGLRDVTRLLSQGEAGPLEDVLRIG
jgi:dATP pyrophosphohydrolase